MAAGNENLKKISRESFDPIWSFIEGKMNETVPDYIKYVLSYCGYNNRITIASIEDDDIKYCVKEVRSGNVTSYYKSKIGDTDILEGCTKNWENFDFSRGHLRYLLDIVAMLKKYPEENEADCFKVRPAKLKQRKSKLGSNTRMKSLSHIPLNIRSTNCSAIEVANNKIDLENPIKRHTRILAWKMLVSLRTLTPTLHAEIGNDINNKIVELIIVKEANIKKQFNTSSRESEYEKITEKKCENDSEELTEENFEELAVENSKKYTASMLCPYCWKSINVFFIVTSGSPRWNSSNFDRHLKLIHCTQDNKTTENISGSEVAHAGNKTEDANISNKSQSARGDSENQVDRGGGGKKAEDNSESCDGDFEVIEIIDNDTNNDTQDARVVNKTKDVRSGKSRDVRVSNKYLHIDNAQAHGDIKIFARGGKKAQDARDKKAEIRDGDADVVKIVNNDSQDPRGGNKIHDALGGNKTQVASNGYKGQVAKMRNDGTENQHASVRNKDQNARDYSDKGEKEPFLKSISRKTNKEKVVRIQSSKVANKAVGEKCNVNNSVIFPKEGDYIICSLPIENSEKWPEDTPVVKNFVGRVRRLKDTILDDAGNSQIPVEIEVQFLENHPHAKRVFINPDATIINTIPMNRIVKILQAPSLNRRGNFVFKDKTLLDYTF